MAKSDFVYRFAVGTPDGPRSAVYRVWSPRATKKKNEDVYVGMRRMGEEFKVSLHGSRGSLAARGHQSVSRDTQTEVGLQNRILDIWNRLESTEHFEPEFEIIVPTSELRTEPEGDDDFAKVNWLAAAPKGGAVQVCLLFHNPVPSDQWPGQSIVDSKLLRHFPLAAGSNCWIVYVARPEAPSEFSARLEATKEKLRRTQPAFSLGDPDPTEAGTRVLVTLARNDRRIGWVEASFTPAAPAA